MEDYRGAKVTINGRGAVICGFKEKFATVTSTDMSLSADFSWKAVDRIMKSGGNFKT
jgi:hypothetical protein